MKVSVSWLKELVNLPAGRQGLKISTVELIKLIPLRVQGGIKEANDEYFELDLKGYNRTDLLSMRGVATEIAAITDSKRCYSDPDKANFAWNKIDATLDPDIQNSDLCPLYCIANIEGLKVEESKGEWVKKLADCGVRSINNIADVTNLVMLEYGQPLHSFDSGKVDRKIVVRKAQDNEEITTLDGKVRKLQSSDLVIADQKKAIGIAGVMGGQNTEVTRSTTSILLEAAIFNPINIRQTSIRLGLTSEASKRFQHGLTKTRLLQALDRAIKMYEDLGGKLTGISIVGDTQDEAKRIQLTQEKVNSLIGVEIKPKDVENYLEKLGFTLTEQGGSWEVTVPYWRLDINLEEDLVEEVARMYGYEKIPAKELQGKLPEKIDQSLFDHITKLKDDLVETGLTEIQTYSFYSTQVLESMGWYEDKNLVHLVKVSNPISAETEYLRMNLWPNLVEAINKNIRFGLDDVAIFEIGKVYVQTKDEPKENYQLSVALMNNSDNPIEELYQITQTLCGNLKGCKLKISQPEGIGTTLFHPKRFVDVEKDGKKIGGLAEVHPRLLHKFGIEKRVAILEIELDPD